MAGAGYKLFNTGDVLTAAQVNTYLQEQTVMVFANAAARTTALSGVLAEGMVTYLKDTDAVEKYDGSTWSSVAGASSPLTTKGDLYTYSTTNARLAVGNNGETLVADSSASTGLRWQGVSAVKPNFAVNGNFDFWQRGTSFTSTGYTADRWYAVVSGTATVARESSVIPDGSTYALKWTTGASTSYAEIAQAFEAADVNAMGGKTVTFSIKVRAQASFASDIFLRLQTNTTADTQTGGAWTTVATTQATPSTSAFNTVSVSYAVPVGTKGLRVYIAVAAAQASGTGLYIGQAQLEIGSVATPFKYSGGTLAGELAACQRYYYREGGDQIYQTFATGYAESGTSIVYAKKHPVTMRVAPTSFEYGTVANYQTGVAAITSNLTQNNAARDLSSLKWTGVTGASIGQVYNLIANNSTSAYVGFSAEL